MKRLIATLLVSISLIYSPVSMSENRPFELPYNVSFGMSWIDDLYDIYNQVIPDLFPMSWSESNYLSILNESTVYNCDTTIIQHRFADNTHQYLDAIRYYFNERTDKEKVKNYKYISSLLTKKFGKPSNNTEDWKDDSVKKKYKNKVDVALLYDYVSFAQVWETEDMVIQHHLYLHYKYENIHHELTFYERKDGEEYYVFAFD